MAAGTELIHLIDLSLGTEPCGVVNFNYLHGLLHEIVKRLVQIEAQTPVAADARVYDSQVTGDTHTQHGVDGEDKEKEATHVGTSSETPAGQTSESPARQTSESPAGQTSESPARQTSESPAGQPSGSLSRQASGTPVRQASGTPMRSMGSVFFKSRGSIVTAANDVGALERKLQDLELRVNTMESLPDMLEKKSSDSGATPVSDMWNFTMLSKRLSATEEGLDKVNNNIYLSCIQFATFGVKEIH